LNFSRIIVVHRFEMQIARSGRFENFSVARSPALPLLVFQPFVFSAKRGDAA